MLVINRESEYVLKEMGMIEGRKVYITVVVSVTDLE